MDHGNEPPKTPPAHVMSDKEFDNRYKEVFNNDKDSNNNTVALSLGAISVIQLPGKWTQRSRNVFIGGSRATAYVQGDKVVSHVRGGGRKPEVLAQLKDPPHKYSEAELNSLQEFAHRPALKAAETIKLKGKTVLRLDLKKESGVSEIRLLFASGALYPEHAESLSFESTGDLASLEKVYEFAAPTLMWNPDRERPGWTPKKKG